MDTIRRWQLRTIGVILSVGVMSSCGGPRETEESPPPPAETSTEEERSLAAALVGTWELAAVERRDASGSELPAPEAPAFGAEGAIGQAILDESGYIGVAIMQQGRPTGAQLSPEEAVADLQGYLAFFGRYATDEGAGQVTVEYQGHRDPRLTGTTATSDVEIVDDRLSVRLAPDAEGIQVTTVWRRLPELTTLTPTHERVIGFWHHVPNEGHTDSDPPIRPGFIIYTSAGRMMVHLMAPDRQTYAGIQPTPEEAQATVSTYTSYFGPFSVDEAGGYFVHHRIGHTINLTDLHKAERRTGLDTDAQRFFEFVGNRMVLRYLSTAGIQPVPAEGDAEWGGMITWERLEGEGQ